MLKLFVIRKIDPHVLCEIFFAADDELHRGGKFVCDNPEEDSDEWALTNGYVSVVPVNADFTNYKAIEKLKTLV